LKHFFLFTFLEDIFNYTLWFNFTLAPDFFMKRFNQIKLKIASTCIPFVCGAVVLLVFFHVFISTAIILYCRVSFLSKYIISDTGLCYFEGWKYFLYNYQWIFFVVNKSEHHALSHMMMTLSDYLIRSVFVFISGPTYMFASFLNRNGVLKDLQCAEKNFKEMVEVEKVTALA